MENEILIGVTSISVGGVALNTVSAAALMMIMVTMGFTLSAKDFTQAFKAPKPVVIGLVAQLVLLPMVAFSIVWLLQPPLAVSLGLIILACCPSGATSNFFSHLARGNVAVSISLTALSGIIVIFTIPVIINLAIYFLTEEEGRVYLPVLQSIIRIFILILAPVIVGMLFRHWQPALAIKIERYATKASFFVVVSLMAVLLWHVWPIFPSMIASAGLAVVMMNVIMMTLGFVLALAFRLKEKDARTICIEVGVQNYLLCVVIAIGLLKEPSYAIVPILYLFVMYVTTFSFIAYCRYVRDAKSSTPREELTSQP